MIHPAQKDKSTSDFGQHAARASSNYTCMQYFARGAAESMLYRCLLGSNGKGFRLQLHTPTSYNAKKPLGGLLAKLPICFSARATVADPRAPRGRDLTCLDLPVNLLIPLPCQSQKEKPFRIGAANLLTSEPPTTEHGGPPTDVDPESKKRNVWNWKACRFPAELSLVSVRPSLRRGDLIRHRISIEPWDITFTVSPADWKPVAFLPLCRGDLGMVGCG
jgi:hypothetical protein